MASRARATQFNSSTLGRLERKVGPERKLAKGAAVAGKRAAIVRRPILHRGSIKFIEPPRACDRSGRERVCEGGLSLYWIVFGGNWQRGKS